ncbi:hypothetical protein [Mycobacterium sp.]|uniref:hypothetical protein n=1 Tax=Mycobacterium sp. TaxID=1785 RepID=UPI003F9B48A3
MSTGTPEKKPGKTTTTPAERRLAAQRGGRDLLGRSAAAVYVMRLEAMLRVAMPKALAGDLKAAEHCRRVLDQEARLYGLNAAGDDSEVRPEPPERDAHGRTVLDRYRQRHGRRS